MSKSARLLTILNLLRSNRRLTTGALATRCGVSERTIYRDVVSLAQAGAPIYYDHGYKLLPGTFLPPMNLTLQEYITLKMALAALPSGRLALGRVVIENILAKIDHAVNNTIPEEVKKSPPRHQIALKSTQHPRSFKLIFDLLRQAVDNDVVVRFDYVSLASGKTNRRVDAYCLVFRGRAYYLIGYCHLRRAMRLFRLDRISRLTVTDQKYERDHQVTPENFFESSWDVFSGEPVKVTLKLTGRAATVVLTGRHHPSESVIEQADGSVKYTVTVAGIEEISRWIIGFGGDAVVLSPRKLADKVYQTACAIERNYRSPTPAQK
ncbi:MAG: YafY family transcriptional regulator [candidate division Zixibacteria bacterium]|nr:YafY family transcriptional regulator [candidate division Zixibacteria bacterium]